MDPAYLQRALEGHVWKLAGEIGERNMWRHQSLEAAGAYIEDLFRESGLNVGEQLYAVEGRAARNLEGNIEGETRAEEIVLVGAHYDSVIGSPGANDNASGVAALLEMGRMLAGSRPERTIRLVAFVNEEPPLCMTPAMGSLVYALRSKKRMERIVGMFSLETIGWYSPEKGTQKFPTTLLRPYYPSAGNFLAMVTNLASARLLRRSLAAFRRHSDFPCRGLAAPSGMKGIAWSDHWSFWRAGYRALMVTDTAPFRYPHYHSRSDTPEKLCYPEMTRAVEGLIRMVAEMAGVEQL